MTKEEIKEIFIEEANEIIEKLDIDILEFEKNPHDKELINEIFRGVHTLKGSANSFGFSRLGGFVHNFEDVLNHYRSSDDVIDTSQIDIFLQAVAVVKSVLEMEINNIDGLPEKYNETIVAIDGILSQQSEQKSTPLADVTQEFSNEPENKIYHIVLTLDDDIYMRGFDHAKLFKLLSYDGKIIESWWDMSDISTLDKFHTQTNSIKRVDIKYSSSSHIDEIQEVFEYLEENEYSIKEWVNKTDTQTTTPEIKQTQTKESHSFVKVKTEKLDDLFESIGELIIAQNFIEENSAIQAIKNDEITQTVARLSKITKLIQNRVMSLRMVTLESTFEKMRLIARDASKAVNKEIELEIEGEQTEIDKTMIDQLSTPLIHLIRNAIDHGIENNREGKDKVGLIRLKAYHKASNIIIEVNDDGRGIDEKKVLEKAIENGFITEDEQLTQKEIYSLLLNAGFSTSNEISEISGRGVGLDVVNASLKSLHGKLEISSEHNKGSSFKIILPLTLAIIDGMSVKSSNNTFIIPTLSVVESFFPTKEMVHTIKHRGLFVDLRGEMLPIVRLNEVLELDNNKPNIWDSTLICVESDKGKYAIVVDELIGRGQIVIKSLGKALSRLKEFSGSAILGNGDIALILNVQELR